MLGLRTHLFHLFIVSLTINTCSAIWCYRCTSATPGCGEKFNWRGIGYLGEKCPEEEDTCVKVIERRGASETIIRDCLSALRAHRTDIPADHYEGCRPAAKDVRLAHYVNNTIKELDVRRDYFDDVTFCMCFLDHRCNSGNSMKTTLSFRSVILVSMIAMIAAVFRKI